MFLKGMDIHSDHQCINFHLLCNIYIYMFMLHKCKLNINVPFNGFLESVVLLIGMFQ